MNSVKCFADRGPRSICFTIACLAVGSLWSVNSSAQVVQLPTLGTFSYGGSVSVPDRGSATLGGNSISAWGRSNRGFRGSGAIGGSGTVGRAGLSAMIIDHRQIDRRIRGLPPTASQRQTVRSPSFRTAHVRSAKVAEGKALVRYARKMRASGHDALANLSYRTAIERLTGPLRDAAVSEYQRVYPVTPSR